MSEGIITANLGQAKYSVQLVYDDAGWVAQVAATNASIADAITKQSDLTIAVNLAFNAKTAAQVILDGAINNRQINTKPFVDKVNKTNKAYRLAKLAFNRNRALIDTGNMHLRWLNSVKPRQDIVVDIFCADFDDTLAVGLHVGLLEINNENPSKQGYVIHPNRTHVADIGDSTYDHARDGSMVTAASIQSSANWAFNEALYIGWQKYQPLYRRGAVTVSNGPNVDVMLDVAISSRTPKGKSFGLNRNPANTADMLRTKAVPVWYMDTLASLTVGDRVVVAYLAQDRNNAAVIGIEGSGGSLSPPDLGSLTAFYATESIHPLLDEGLPTNLFGLQPITLFDEIRGLSYTITGNSVVVTEYGAMGLGATGSYTFVVPFSPVSDTVFDSKAAFVTPTGFDVYNGESVAVTVSGGVVSFVSNGPSSANESTLINQRASYTGANTGQQSNTVMSWVKTGAASYKRIVRVIKHGVWIDTSPPQPDNGIGWDARIDISGYYEEHVFSGGTLTVNQVGPSYLLGEEFWAIGWGTITQTGQRVVNASLWLGNNDIGTGRVDFYSLPSSLTIMDSLITLLNKGVDWKEADGLQNFATASPLHRYDYTRGDKLFALPPPVFGSAAPYTTVSDKTKPVRSDNRFPLQLFRRPTIWVIEPTGVGGAHTTTKAGAIVYSVKRLLTQLTNVQNDAVWMPQLAGPPIRTGLQTLQNDGLITESDIWRVLGRAPLAKSTLPDPGPAP